MSGVSHIVSACSAEGAGFLNKYLEIRKNRVSTHTGLARQDTANYLTYKELAGFFNFPQAIFIKENRPTHTVSPPRGNAQAGILHIPRPHTVQGKAAPVCHRGFLYPIKNK